MTKLPDDFAVCPTDVRRILDEKDREIQRLNWRIDVLEAFMGGLSDGLAADLPGVSAMINNALINKGVALDD